jgi:rhamnose utilization protein RhaD (predicted bifunctional aldolase and dehydrogenase)
MNNLWSDAAAAGMTRQYAAKGVAEDIALRVYTSRLIGAEKRLVIHGGGNTSVKTRIRDMIGRDREVLCVKGSGWDLDTIEPAGLPALDL